MCWQESSPSGSLTGIDLKPTMHQDTHLRISWHILQCDRRNLLLQDTLTFTFSEEHDITDPYSINETSITSDWLHYVTNPKTITKHPWPKLKVLWLRSYYWDNFHSSPHKILRASHNIMFANSCNKFSNKWQLIRDSIFITANNPVLWLL